MDVAYTRSIQKMPPSPGSTTNTRSHHICDIVAGCDHTVGVKVAWSMSSYQMSDVVAQMNNNYDAALEWNMTCVMLLLLLIHQTYAITKMKYFHNSIS